MLSLMATSNLIDIARGLSLPKLDVLQKRGRRSDVGATEQDVWTAGQADSGAVVLRTAPNAPGTVSVVSSSAQDNATGTGARKVEVDVLDENWARQSYVIVPTGVTPASSASTEQAIRIQGVRVTEAGSGGVNAGRVDVSVGGNVQASVPIGLGRSQEAMVSVPAGFKAYVLRAFVESPTADVVVRLYRRVGAAGGVPSLQLVREWRTSSGAMAAQELTQALEAIDPKSDLLFRASVAAGSAWVGAGVDLLLVAL